MTDTPQAQNIVSQQNSSPWTPQQPYLAYGFEQSAGRYNDPSSRVARFSPRTQQGMGAIEQRATQGSPLVGQASQMVGDTLSGDYLRQGNPHIGGVVSALDRQIAPQVQSRFAAAGGAGGSDLEQETYAKAMADATAPYMFQNYSQERDRMGQAVGQAQQLGQEPYNDARQLLNIGAQEEGLQQQILSEPDILLDQYLQRTGAGYGSAGTTTTPYFRNRLSGAAGGALAGLQLGNEFMPENKGLAALLGGAAGYY